MTQIANAEYVAVPNRLTRLTCYGYNKSSRTDIFDMRRKGDLTVERTGNFPDYRYMIQFAWQASPYYCHIVEWSTRSDMATTGSTE